MDFQDLFCFTTLASLLLALADAENPQIVPSREHGQDQGIPGQGIHQMNQEQRASRFRDKNHIQDKDHIMEHLEDIIDKPESEMSEAELQLHYFKMHDYDNNNKLDGLELIQALTHFHHDEEGKEGKQQSHMSEKEMEELIDPILKEEDDNNDGYIDYPEFAKTQN